MALRRLEDEVGRRLGDSVDPLLVSVRSGAKYSMPGMMETVLNVGLNDRSVLGLVEASGDERFAWDSYRRLIQMFGKTVLGVDGEAFGEALDAAKARKGVETDVELEAKDLQELVDEFKQIIVDHTGEEFPQDPRRRSTWPPARSSTRGTPTARSSTAGANGSPTTSAPRSTCARWCSATSAPPPAPASASPGTRRRGSQACTATTSPMHRARTSSRAFATPCRSTTSPSSTRTPTRS